MEAANAFLPRFMVDYNRRFAVQPRSSDDAHRPVIFSQDELDIIFTHQESRVLSKNLTFQYNKVIYQIQPPGPTYVLRNAQVTVCENAQGEITVLRYDRPLRYSVFHRQERQAQVVTSKEISSHLEKLKEPHKPAANHPWRRYGQRVSGKPIPESRR